jgi:hypothetical protein
MGRIIVKLIGLILLIAGLYFLGKNIFFASSFSRYFWYSLPATGSIVCLMSGVITLLFFRRAAAQLGWVLLGIGIILVFLSGGVFLKPTSLSQFLISFTAFAAGYKLLTEGRVDF